MTGTGPDRGADLAAEHLIALAREDFLVFVMLMFPILHGGEKLKHAPYIDYVCYELWRCGAPHRRRVIFNMPPGYMKSMLISVLYVAWRLGVNPGLRFICASYGDDVAHKFGRQARQIMQSPLYRAIFPGTVLTKTAENFLETSQGGLRYATNVGGEIAGFRANCIILDDPMQPDDSHRAEAKQKLVDWYQGVVAQRLLAEGSILVVMHRLAPDDFCGTLQELGPWHVVNLPLIAEEERVYKDYRGHVLWHRRVGEVLNPNYRSVGEVATLKRELSPEIFDAQCQQRPRFGGSGMCSIDRLTRYLKPPPFELKIHSWDLAGTRGGGDWTACAQFGLARDSQGRDLLYLTAVLRMRVELPDVRAIIAAQDQLERPALIIIDANGIGIGVYQDLWNDGLKHAIKGQSLYQARTSQLKAQTFHHGLRHLYDGLILLPETMQGLSSLFDELAAFPDGKYDDQVDALMIVGAYRERVLKEARNNAERCARWTPDHRAALERARQIPTAPPYRSRYFDRN
jgi:phage terminase large subunit-like protein